MFEILLGGYENIGPFEKPILVHYKKGNFLISAPIGSGKSFLFFDAPVIALYKNSGRPAINKNSKTASINLIFRVDEDYFLIVRKLKTTKTGESMASRFYKIISGVEKISNFETISNQIFDEKIFGLEELELKNEIDLQKFLESIIPSKDVLLNTSFLMQDSLNIFELSASERIQVFKTIFGFFDIDKAKDILSEKKKNVSIALKLLLQDDTFEKINQIEKNWDELGHSFGLIDEITQKDIEEFLENLRTQISDYNGLENVLGELKKQKNSLSDQIFQTKNQIEKNNFDIQNIEKIISSYDPGDFEKISLELKNINIEQKKLSEKIPFLEYENYSSTAGNIREAQKFVDNLINIGTQNRQKLETLQKLKESSKNQILEFENQLKNLELVEGNSSYENLKRLWLGDERQKAQDFSLKSSQKIRLGENIAKLSSQLEKLRSQFKQENTYFCKKIEAPCPFVQDIKKQSNEYIILQGKNLESDLKNLTSELENLVVPEYEKTIFPEIFGEKEIEIYEKNYPEFFQQLQNEKNNISEKIKSLQNTDETQINDINLQNQNLIKYLSSIDYKSILENIKNYDEFSARRENLENEISKIQKSHSEFENAKIEKQNLIEKNQIFISQNENLNIQFGELEKNITSQEKKLQDIDLNNLKSQISISQQAQNLFLKYETYGEKRVENLKKIEDLKKQEQMLADMTKLFSKDILLVVLSEFLPIVENMLNQYLARIVDYEIRLNINGASTSSLVGLEIDSSDKLELDIQIVDSHGTRQVKSLSGGQKVILKIVWTLVIAIYMNSSMIFMDETINNLDNEAIEKVADLLRDFVAQNKVKFYVVTHNDIIKSMNIWDDIIYIKN